MSAITHETRSVRHAGRKPGANHMHMPALFRFLRKAAVKNAHLPMQISNAFAEARTHRAMIEAELYRSRYTHASKNDDELPIGPLGPAEPTQPSRMTWHRFADAVVTAAKHAYPAILVLSLLSTALAATFAIRLAIWLPSHLY